MGGGSFGDIYLGVGANGEKVRIQVAQRGPPPWVFWYIIDVPFHWCNGSRLHRLDNGDIFLANLSANTSLNVIDI